MKSLLAGMESLGHPYWYYYNSNNNRIYIFMLLVWMCVSERALEMVRVKRFSIILEVWTCSAKQIFPFFFLLFCVFSSKIKAMAISNISYILYPNKSKGNTNTLASCTKRPTAWLTCSKNNQHQTSTEETSQLQKHTHKRSAEFKTKGMQKVQSSLL